VGKRNDENFSYFNYFLLLFFLNLCIGYRMWGEIWDEICPILLLFFFLNLCVGCYFLNFFFLNCSCLIKFGPFKLLIFYS
jgi:hypothetical protein